MPSSQAQATLGQHQFWRVLRAQSNFYGTLPLMPDARRLFDAVAHLHPIILTGCPLGGWAESQKQGWAAEHFPGTHIITCLAREKRLYLKPGDILVDDTLKFSELWEEAGGIFVHHTSAESTLSKLQQLEILHASPKPRTTARR